MISLFPNILIPEALYTYIFLSQFILIFILLSVFLEQRDNNYVLDGCGLPVEPAGALTIAEKVKYMIEKN